MKLEHCSSYFFYYEARSSNTGLKEVNKNEIYVIMYLCIYTKMRGGDKMKNTGIRFDYLAVSVGDSFNDYIRLQNYSMEMERLDSGIPMYGLGFENNYYRLYIQNDYSDKYPCGLVVFHHEILWANMIDVIFDVIDGFNMYHHISRVDLSCLFNFDWYNSEFQDVNRIMNMKMGKVRTIQPIFKENRIETWYFGDLRNRRKIIVRIYDKLAEIEKSKKYYMLQDDFENVINVEIEMRRDYLRKYGINNIEELYNNIEKLWYRIFKKYISMQEKNGVYTKFWTEILSVKRYSEVLIVRREWVDRDINIERMYKIVEGLLNTIVEVEGKELTKIKVDNLISKLEGKYNGERKIKIEKVKSKIKF